MTVGALRKESLEVSGLGGFGGKKAVGSRRAMSETPSFDYLLATYFHQDWPDIEGSTTDAVLERFAREDSSETVASARDEAVSLLAQAASEDELASELRFRRLNYRPEADGLTYTQWLRGVVERLDALASQTRG